MRGIRFKLWIYTSLLLTALLLIVYLMQSSIIDRFYINSETSNIRDEALKLSAMLSGSKDWNTVNSELNYAASLTGGRIAIYDKDGSIVATSGHIMQGRAVGIEDELLPYVLKGEEKQLKDSRGEEGVSMSIMSLGVPIKSGSSIAGAVFIHVPTTPMEDAVVKLKRQFLLLILISILLSTVGAILISRRFTNPIIKIKNTSEKIAKGEYGAKINIKGRDEFHDLAETINNLALDLGKTERMRKDFIANVSHEFRTPLGVIKAYAEALSDNVVPEEDKKEYIDAIIDESVRLNDMVNGILDLARIESGNLRLKKEQLNLYELISEVVEKLKILAGSRDIKVAGEKIYYLGDKDTLTRAFINIIGNAIEHTGEDGEITIDIRQNDKTIVAIRDSGEGIDKEHLPYIFERFYRAKNTRGGSGGLGLPIAREIIRAHGGEIEVKSSRGEGTEFTIKLSE